jgi:hypothetical protein
MQLTLETLQEEQKDKTNLVSQIQQEEFLRVVMKLILPLQHTETL